MKRNPHESRCHTAAACLVASAIVSLAACSPDAHEAQAATFSDTVESHSTATGGVRPHPQAYFGDEYADAENRLADTPSESPVPTF
jgi:hypothetical protein